MQKGKAGIKRVIHDNKIWLNHINYIFQYYIDNNRDFNLYVEVYYPHNILLSIYRQLIEESGHVWLPTYRLSFDFSNTNTKKLYLGIIVWDGTKNNLETIVDRYYSGNASSLAWPMIWGGYEDDDLKIMKDLGLHFDTLLYEASSEEEILAFKLENFEFIPTTDFRSASDSFMLFVKENDKFIQNLVNLIDSCLIA